MLGIQDPTKHDTYVLPTFPTHDELGNRLQGHKCLLPDSLLHNNSIAVYLTEWEEYEKQRDSSKLIFRVDGTIF